MELNFKTINKEAYLKYLASKEGRCFYCGKERANSKGELWSTEYECWGCAFPTTKVGGSE